MIRFLIKSAVFLQRQVPGRSIFATETHKRLIFALCFILVLCQPYKVVAVAFQGDQSNAAKPATFIGTVQSISGKTLTVKSDAGLSMQIVVDAGARLLRIGLGQTTLQNAQPMNFGDLEFGDRVMVRGTSSADGNQVHTVLLVAIKKSAIAAQQQQSSNQADKPSQTEATVYAPSPPDVTIGLGSAQFPCSVSPHGTSPWDITVSAKNATEGEIAVRYNVHVLGTRGTEYVKDGGRQNMRSGFSYPQGFTPFKTSLNQQEFPASCWVTDIQVCSMARPAGFPPLAYFNPFKDGQCVNLADTARISFNSPEPAVVPAAIQCVTSHTEVLNQNVGSNNSPNLISKTRVVVNSCAADLKVELKYGGQALGGGESMHMTPAGSPNGTFKFYGTGEWEVHLFACPAGSAVSASNASVVPVTFDTPKYYCVQ
jgi:hypothetical protein